VSIGEIITELQSLGVRFQGRPLQRRGGAGPAEAGFLLVEGIPVSVPMISQYVSISPYFLKNKDDHTFLFKNSKELFPINFISRPKFYDYSTKDGIGYKKIALLHGKDCLATSVIQTCTYWNSPQRCRFCGIELSLKDQQTIELKTPEQLAEVAFKAMELDSVNHIVLTTGSDRPPGKEIGYLSKCASAIKEVTGLPIHAQFLPPSEPNRISELKEAGVDTVGVHIESFDSEILSRVAPLKVAIGLNRYEETWKMAVDLFGPNQVSSFLLVGLGEKVSSVIWGSEFLADLGVYPLIVPLRPIPGSLMEDSIPPDPEVMKHIYKNVADILRKKGLSSSKSLAGCVRCGACSALPTFEHSTDRLICHPVRNKHELSKALEIRKEVFVLEQKIFKDSDLDENDHKSIHLVAKIDGKIIGAVRVFPSTTGNGHWIGGRLAVRKGHRISSAGESLVREAMRYVKRHGCTRFTAHIQQKNVHFFSKLGWKSIEPVENYLGLPHQLMEADLEPV
jgi:radical SAM protein (TIGR04043 family)/putative N-acetyltransferase (TIGR04045 family)